MAYYFIRVELHGANESDYNSLHELLKDKGYQRSIYVGDPAKVQPPGLAMLAQFRKLPTGTYTLKSNVHIDTVITQVTDIASRVKTNPMVVVAECMAIRYCNLPCSY